jgi:ketosteroid isomerase-like protein
LSRENVKIIRRAFDVFKRGGIEAAMDYYDEAVVTEESPRWPDRKTYHGHDGVRQAWEKLCDAFEDPALDAEDFIETDDGRVVVFIRATGRIPDSDARIDARIAYLYTLHEGKIVRLQVYDDREDALEAAGARRSAGSY